MEQPGLLTNFSPSMICEQILWLVKNSNLNFNVQETPFSLNLRLKKSFVTKWPNAQENTNSPIPQEFVKNLENKDKQIYNLEHIVKDLKEQLAASNTKNEGCVNVTAKLKAIGDEKRHLQIKHEKMCADNKTLKNENESLKTDLKGVNIAIKTSQKESKDASHRLEKKI